MFRNLFQTLFGMFSRKAAQETKQAEERLAESLLIQRMIDQAQAIARGEDVSESHLPKPQIPERRKNPR